MQWVSFIWTTKWVWGCRCRLGRFRRREKFSNQFYKERKNYTQERNQFSQSIWQTYLHSHLPCFPFPLQRSPLHPGQKKNHCEVNSKQKQNKLWLTSESGWWFEVAVESCSSLWGGEEARGCFGEVVGGGGAWEPGELLVILHCCNCCLVCTLN